MTDVVGTIRAYDAWRIAREYEDNLDLPALYAKHLETEKELRILKATRHYFERSVLDDIDFLGALFDGDVEALEEEEAKYED